MTTPDPNPESLFPAAVFRPAPAKPAAEAVFSAPATVDFPLDTYPEDAAISPFGKRIQSDQDRDMIDVYVSHVRDVSFQPESAPIPAFATVVPVAAPAVPVVASVVPVRVPRRSKVLMIVLAIAALGALTAVGWLVLQM